MCTYTRTPIHHHTNIWHNRQPTKRHATTTKTNVNNARGAAHYCNAQRVLACVLISTVPVLPNLFERCACRNTTTLRSATAFVWRQDETRFSLHTRSKPLSTVRFSSTSLWWWGERNDDDDDGILQIVFRVRRIYVYRIITFNTNECWVRIYEINFSYARRA